MWIDLRYAIRMLAKSPGFALIAILTLALGIGANTAIFTVANTLLLRPLPYADPGRLALLFADRRGQLQGFSYLRYTLLREQSRAFSGVAAFASDTFNLTGQGDPEQLSSARISANFFDVLGVRPETEPRPSGSGLDVQVPHIQRILFDELAPALDILAHQRRENGFGLGQVLQVDLQERARLGVHGGRP
jgi:hypothetical protein